MHGALTLLLTTSAVLAAMPEPDWSHAGILGLVVYALVTLGLAWIGSPRDRLHRDDCATLLRQIAAGVTTLLERGGDASPLPPCGRHPRT